MQQDPDAPRLPIRRVARTTNLARYRVSPPHEGNAGSGRLFYALLIIVLLQIVVLSFIAFFLALLLLLNFGNLLYRPATDAEVTALIRTPTPSASTPVATAVLTNTVMPQPTQIEQMTPTAPIPTPLPAPTTTLLPPPTAVPVNNVPAPGALPPELQTYANQVLPSVNNATGALSQLQGLAQAPSLNDPQWVTNVTSQINIIQTTQANLQAIQAPPAAMDVHNALLNAINACRAAVDSFSSSMTSHDANNLAAATPHIQSCFAQFPEAAGRVHTLLRQ